MTKEELKKENLKIDLREIDEQLKNEHVTIMASEYTLLTNKKREILKRLGL